MNDTPVRAAGQNLTLAAAVAALRDGDLAVRLPENAEGAAAFNELAEMLGNLDAEVRRVSLEIGTQGRFGPQALVPGARGGWATLVSGFNAMAANLTNQVRNIAGVTAAVATGDLAQKITVDAQGETLELKDRINLMVDQLNTFASEMTRVARELGTEGRFGGQMEVAGVAGSWKHLVENFNFMAASLTDQFRNIAQITAAVAGGDTGKRVTVGARGETAELKETLNAYADKLGGKPS